MPPSVFDLQSFDGGVGFGRSSIRPVREIQKSDVLMIPDPASAFVDPFKKMAFPMATKFNPATACSRLRRTEMIGRRLCRADKHQYSCPPRPMTITTRP